MKSNKEILDELGERIIKDCFDGYIKQVTSLRVKRILQLFLSRNVTS